ncbi:DNA binding protein [Imshaugia aleurites]|uniref:DNA binding protein n=1 Tax=Imshaugia aleurites TaxID=172621 RepID=A0A8H3FN77_9LECA|nr:DNA binding protein [Imshaugia aleurites]
MASKQTHRPKLKTARDVHEEVTSPLMPEAISLYDEDHAVEEKQSYAMMKALLRVLVAGIADQRRLFPKSCFEILSPSSIRTAAHGSYQQADARSNSASSNDELAHFATALAQQGQSFVVLVPGKTNGADQLLAWLDEIFKGLLDRSLDGFQFSIYADKSRPSDILELYTFSFQYRDGKAGERELMGLTAPGRGSSMITTKNIRYGMVNMINQLDSHRQQLPVLPKERYLMCHLFHSPKAPRHPPPPGFHPCTDTKMAVIENGLWSMKQRNLGSINSGSHLMRLGTSFMARTDAAEELNHQPVLSQKMEHTRFISRNLESNFETGYEDQAAPPESTRMLKRPRGGFKSHDSLSGHSNLPTQVMDLSAVPSWTWKLRPGRKVEMRVKKDKQQWIAARDDRIVRCECSCDWEELPMLQCTCCQKLQHYQCYGFALVTNVQEHYCYQCLFEDTRKALLTDMKLVAIFRRALWILYEKNASSPAEFAQMGNFHGKTTQELIERLDEGGYLASGRTRLSPVRTPEQLSIRRTIYQNPSTSIGRFYEPGDNTPPANTDSEDANPQRKRIRGR